MWTWLRKGNLKRETNSLLIAAENNAIRTNHIKARIDKTRQNSKCSSCGDREETINHVISECRKLAQEKYKTRHDWVGKRIPWELCQKLKFDHTNIWFTLNTESVLGKEIHKLVWNFEIQTNFGQTTITYNNQQKRENLQNFGLCSPSRPQSETERKRKDV